MFHSIWWRLPLFEFWWISWHSAFIFLYQTHRGGYSWGNSAHEENLNVKDSSRQQDHSPQTGSETKTFFQN